MTVSSGFKGIGEKELKTDWPHEEGLELGTTKRSEEPFLEAEEENLISDIDEERL